MHDWESVISKDKKEQYVSLWYTQVMEDNKGKTDSLAIMDDVKLKMVRSLSWMKNPVNFPKKNN